MRMGEGALQYFEDLNTQIFRRRNGYSEFLKIIQIFQIVARKHLFFNAFVEVNEIADHPRRLLNRAADGHFEGVVVPVSMGVVALAVGLLILLGRHGGAVETM